MSRQLESLLDRQRRADCAANEPITSAREIRATGNHLAAQNDEREPPAVPDRKLAEMFAGAEPFEVEPCDIPREHRACPDCLDRGCPRCWS